MRAIRRQGTQTRLVTDAADPTPRPGEALIRPLRLGIGPADVFGGSPGFSGILGHEFVGIVEQINLPSDAPPMLRMKESLLGKRVVGSPNVICGSCDMCRAGLSAHCRGRRVMGVYGCDGCFADRFATPLLNLHVVPQRLDDERAVLASLVARGLHIAQLVRVEARSFVTVLGQDALALVTAQSLARLNASVRLLGSDRNRIGLCEKWGVKHRPLDEVGRRQDQEVVVDCTGSAAGLRLAMQLVRPRGAIVLASGRTLPPAPAGQPLADPTGNAASDSIDLAPLMANEVQVLGSRDGPLPDALAVLESGDVEVVSLITRRMKLDEGVKAIEMAAQPDQIKVLLEP